MIVYTHEQLSEQIDYFLTKDSFAFDVETLAAPNNAHRANPRLNRVHWLSLATDGRCLSIPLGFANGTFDRLDFPLTPTGEKWVAEGKIPKKHHFSKDMRKAKHLFHEPPSHLRFDAEVKSILEPLFFSDRLKIAQNAKFDVESLAKHFGGRLIPRPYFDTLIAGFVLDMRNKGHLDLASQVEREIGYKMIKGVGTDISLHSFMEVAKYAYLDAKYTYLLAPELRRQLEESGLAHIFRLEMDVLEAVIAMEHAGAPVDVNVLSLLGEELATEKSGVEEDVYRLSGKSWNIGSNAERQTLLYGPKAEGGMGLRQTMLTPGGKAKKKNGVELTIKDYAVSAIALEKFEAKPLVANLMRWDTIDKLIGSFVVPYIGGSVTRTTGGKSKVEERESLLVKGRIHAKFNQIGTDTGRFSSTEPNLMQVPSRTAEGKKIRSAFVAPDGWSMVVADYSQIEPRIIADMSGSKVLIDTYLDGGDIYVTLAEPFGLDRAAGKLLVLSVSYGVGADKAAGALGIPLKEAKKLIYEDFPKRFPEIDQLKRRVIREARSRRPVYVSTLMGRRRYLPELWSTDQSTKSRAERQAFNAVIQGSAADINKVGLVRAHRMLPPECELILTVHDEIVVLAPDHLADETAPLLREAMEGASVLKRVPLIAEAKVAKTWAEGK